MSEGFELSFKNKEVKMWLYFTVPIAFIFGTFITKGNGIEKLISLLKLMDKEKDRCINGLYK